MLKNLCYLLFLLSLGCAAQRDLSGVTTFDQTHDRTWVGADYWAVPLEGWRVHNGRIECNSNVPQARLHLLTQALDGGGDFRFSVRMGLVDAAQRGGRVGFLLGIRDEVDDDVRAACYFGEGLPAGIDLGSNELFIGEQRVPLPADFNAQQFTLSATGQGQQLVVRAEDEEGRVATVEAPQAARAGLVALAANLGPGKPGGGRANVWFDDLRLDGSGVVAKPEQSFGPILWTTHTLSRATLKLMAQMPPLGDEDEQQVELQLQRSGQWTTVATEPIEADSRTAIFKIENWDSTTDHPYRVVYNETGRDGNRTPAYYEGTIRRDPTDRPLKVAGLTCQNHVGYPYGPLVDNLQETDPDFLFFSGDQIYEGNGGYPIIREPADSSILSYLGKYYMFGWAFADLMRDRPTVCTPDDHDVFHGNLWGDGGKLKDQASDDESGFVQSVRMVNAVNRSQCGNLPDPYDPTPIGNDMSVWYTDLVYGRVSFAIVSDRIFKSGPEMVAIWGNRQDHIRAPLDDPSILNKPGLQLMGDRQEDFLRQWVEDWTGADMKVLLSQTLFANVATHHGAEQEFLYGDLDSGGWPKEKRDEVVSTIRKGFAFHINGDQHLPSLVQYGVDDYRDAGWSFCTPAIAVGYQRAFLPDELGWPVRERPAHGLPNTGQYEDALGNENFVYAVGNPAEQLRHPNRYKQAQLRASGFGLITFDQRSRDITMDCYQFESLEQFAGWPVTLNQLDNYGGKTDWQLPTLRVNTPEQVVRVYRADGELLYNVRMAGHTFTPKVFAPGNYTVVVGEGSRTRRLENVAANAGGEIRVDL